MKWLLAFFLFIFLSYESFGAGPARVYTIEGFPFQSPFRAAWKFGVETVEEHLKSNFPKTKFQNIHNNNWFSICKDLKELPPEEKPEKLMVIGHSYGAWAAVQLSLCLKGELNIDTLVTIDPITKIAHDPNADKLYDIRNIPENVKKHYNYYESSDLFLSGIDNMKALNIDFTESSNQHIQVGLTFSPHNRIVEILAESARLQLHIDETLNE